MTETRIPTEAEARAELEPVFAALARAYVARYAVKEKHLRSAGRLPKPEEIYRNWLRQAVETFRQHERYHEMHWGPIQPPRDMVEVTCPPCGHTFRISGIDNPVGRVMSCPKCRSRLALTAPRTEAE